jgi:hypothetical protein
MRLDLARAVADAALYERYLYPYRANSSENESRWRFGVLGPMGAEAGGWGESSTMSMQCLLTSPSRLVLHLRFLQVQHRVSRDSDDARGVHVSSANGRSWLAWDETVEQELTFELSPFDLEAGGTVVPLGVKGGDEKEPSGVGERGVIRRRWPLTAEMRAATVPSHGCIRLDVTLLNLHAGCTDTDDATRHSLIGTHVIIEAHDTDFVSILEPPEQVAAAAAACTQHRLWPVLGGESGDTDLLLGLPVILGDHPEITIESFPPESVDGGWPGPPDIQEPEPPASGADANFRR